jgi:heme exporter protein C
MDTTHDELFDGKSMKTPPLLVALSAIAAGMICFGLWMAFYYAPIEKEMGFVQKIFYFHVASAWMAMLAPCIMAVASIGYLIKKTDGWDRWGDAAVELSIVFGMMVLISGPLWGRKAWGVYWVWDVRLTSFLILVLTLVAAKIVRSYAGPAAKQISAGLGVFAVLDTAFVYFCVKFWRTTHPQQVTGAGKLDPLMKETMWFCVVAFLIVFICLFWSRLRAGRLRTGLDRLYMRATEAGLHD